jgi:hypothetical protein
VGLGIQVKPLKREAFWFALLGTTALSQTAHLGEHIIQMAQIHLLAMPAAQARGLVGMLDIEIVHFGWNLWIALALVLLVRRYPSALLTFAVVFSLWHLAEHVLMISTYLTTGVSGSPGFLSKGGLIGGGLPLRRPDLHFIYNLIETAPLLAAFILQWRRENATA